jgi:two-component system, NarL family, nitrate/nitrite response regulator NarL
MPCIRTLIVDDHPLVRDGLRSRFARSDEVMVVGEACDGQEALEKVQELNPEVVLLDINMPVLNGIQAAEAIMDVKPDTIILVLSMHDDREYVVQLIELGARGYVLKSASAEEMLNAIRAVHSGGVYYSPSVADALLNKPASPTDSLTDREQIILGMLAQGLSSKASAAQLNISPRTVETHRRNIKKKLGLNSMPALIRCAIDCGLGSERTT